MHSSGEQAIRCLTEALRPPFQRGTRIRAAMQHARTFAICDLSNNRCTIPVRALRGRDLSRSAEYTCQSPISKFGHQRSALMAPEVRQ